VQKVKTLVYYSADCEHDWQAELAQFQALIPKGYWKTLLTLIMENKSLLCPSFQLIKEERERERERARESARMYAGSAEEQWVNGGVWSGSGVWIDSVGWKQLYQFNTLKRNIYIFFFCVSALMGSTIILQMQCFKSHEIEQKRQVSMSSRAKINTRITRKGK